MVDKYRSVLGVSNLMLCHEPLPALHSVKADSRFYAHNRDRESKRVGVGRQQLLLAVLNLEAGRYLNRFVVDGNWQSDPLNTRVEPCPGRYNSVLVVEGKPAEAPS